jgi:pantoate--beta-alanine ligase
MQVFGDIEPMHRQVCRWRAQGLSVGVVPTMGALHAGHLSLVEQARRRCDRVVVTIFVNPTQFGPEEDYLNYPRPIEADLAACRDARVDAVFHPAAETMYPCAPLSRVHVRRMSELLCGAFRPGHFDGVAAVVLKLFHIIPAGVAFFGEKDYQQLTIIRRMVYDLNVSIEIVGCPIVREPDGLAMSSRNAYLTETQRKQATVIHRALSMVVNRVGLGERRSAELRREARAMLNSAGPCTVEYVEIVDRETLESLETVDHPARICAAVRIGSCRLIDNAALTP